MERTVSIGPRSIFLGTPLAFGLFAPLLFIAVLTAGLR